ncbi:MULTISPECIES: endonuclease/exonuclease/phosphatase family protein [Levilactobacillus]|uniref:endonuclease/exonuclease/phosphatase family protein n=1 Tax=Levilactobacillus TaxID=2767886 RepID=UPI001950C404|nr:endonuclease/exonuclease/phosphatase family protein [Levilactobacillus sp. 244-2]
MLKVMTVNVPPMTKSGSVLRESQVSDKQRLNLLVAKIQSVDAEIIFFLEEDPAIFEEVVARLSGEYAFYYPQGFTRSWYAGVVVAIKKTLVNDHARLSEAPRDGTGIVSKSGKWQSVMVDGEVILAVHCPQPNDPDYADFRRKINQFSRDKAVTLVAGDWNPQAGTQVSLADFQDVLPTDSTTAFDTKLDYIFVRRGRKYQHVLLDKTCMTMGDNLFSDHAVTSVELN